MTLNEKRWLTPSDVEQIYEITEEQQAKYRTRKSKIKIPFSKIGKFVRYDRQDLDIWFEQHKVVEIVNGK